EFNSPVARWKRKGLLGRSVRLTIAALAIETLRRQLRGRLLHDRGFVLLGKGGDVADVTVFEPANDARVAFSDEGFLVVHLPRSLVETMAADLRAQGGVYRWPPLKDFEIEVVPTEITDQSGKLIRVIG